MGSFMQKKAINSYQRKLFYKYEVKHYILRSLIKTCGFSQVYRYWFYFLQQKYCSSSAKSIIKNCCSVSGKQRSVFKLSNCTRFAMFYLTQKKCLAL